MSQILLAPDLTGSPDRVISELCDYFFIPQATAVPVERFVTIVDEEYRSEFVVDENTCSTALFLVYCAVQVRRSFFVLSEQLQQQFLAYQRAQHPGDRVIHQEDSSTPTTTGVILTFKSSFILPYREGRKVEELIRFAWDRRDTLHPETAVPLIRNALDILLDGIEAGHIPVTSMNSENLWPSQIWVDRARELSIKLGMAHRIAP